MWRVRFWLLLGALLATLTIAPARAQQTPPIDVTATVDRVEMRIGDLLTYELRVDSPPGVNVTVPEQPAGSFEQWEVRSCSALPADGDPSDGMSSGWRCVLTIWTVGEHQLPTLQIAYTSDSGSGTVSTRPLTVKVVSVLDENPIDIRPLKPQVVMNDPSNLLMLIGIMILALLAIGAAIVAMTYLRNSRPVPVPAAVVPTVDPVTAALRELDRIAGLGLVQEGKIAEHCVLIAEALRTYILRRYGVPALHRTTAELRSTFGSLAPRDQQQVLVSLLSEIDAVKFARRLPAPEEAQQLLDRARQSILASR